ncbi:Hypothetical protein PHPALM_9916 [Phytophthora palmivora]|uniref:Uncharacterized protein n=1 Tax=Phytophthora palmivora TaxID=4796 RepID=A0A2P4Y622_9STRA|nr:Hypothetical protein PHPALM_9916 [Phytophthora palmivora]
MPRKASSHGASALSKSKTARTTTAKAKSKDKSTPRKEDCEVASKATSKPTTAADRQGGSPRRSRSRSLSPDVPDDRPNPRLVSKPIFFTLASIDSPPLTPFFASSTSWRLHQLHSLHRGASALGVSSGRGNPVIDLTTSLETGPGSGPYSCTSSPRQQSSPGDTTSDATIKSSSVGVAAMDPLSTLVMEHGDSHRNKHIQLARLIALALTQPPEPSDSTQRQAILHAESAGALKRLGSSLDQVAQLKLQLETSERECHLWKREVDKSVGLVTSLRKALTASGAELKQARAAQTAEVTATQSALHAAELMIKSRDEDITALSRSIVERDEAYKILQGVSAKHFQQLQEIVLSLDDDGSHKLRHAKKTIDEMRETILRQKRVIGRLPMHDPHMAAAAGAGLDVPGMDPASLKLNARLCRLLAERFPEVMRIPDGEDRVVELRICSRQSGSAGVQTSASNSAAVPTPGSGSASTQVPLRHRPSRAIEALRRVRKKLTPSQRLHVLANPESVTAAGPRKRKVALPPLQPYGQPLPGEDGYEEAAALIGPPDDRLLAASDSELTVPTARPLPRRRKMAAISTSSSQTAPSVDPIVKFGGIDICSLPSRVDCCVNSAKRSSTLLVVDEHTSSDGGTAHTLSGSLHCPSGRYTEFRDPT